MTERPLPESASGPGYRPPVRTADRLARALSYVLSPYVVTALTASAVTVAYARPSLLGVLQVLVAITSSTLVPFLFTLWMVRTGRTTDMHAAIRSQRHPIFLVAIVSNSVATLFLWATGAHPLVVAMGVAYCASGALFWAVTTVWKISLHTGVLAGSLMIAAHAFGDLALYGLPLLPLVAWARVRRRRHTLSQVTAGAVCGAAVTYLALSRCCAA